LIAAVFDEFRTGKSSDKIKDVINSRYGNRLPRELNREDPYDLIRYAAAKGRIGFVPTTKPDLKKRLEEKMPWRLESVDVVLTPVAQHVAAHGARMLLNLLEIHYARNRDKTEIHVGFAGGASLQLLAQEFAILLGDFSRRIHLPKLVFHAMVGGLNTERPTNPNAFATYLVNDFGTLQVETGFIGLHAPAIVSKEHHENLMKIDDIRNSIKRAEELDCVVTSAGRWACGHSIVYKMLGSNERDRLKEQGCQGDILWSPFSASGPVKIDHGQMAMVLMDLNQLENFVNRGKRVLLVLGPCGECMESKPEILKCFMRSKTKFFTDLVVDSTCARRATADADR
jgi:DNA-binding transcriptional regulator LsrR (DeoR family)